MTTKDRAYVITYPDERQEVVRAKILRDYYTWPNGTEINPQELDFGRCYRIRESDLKLEQKEVWAEVATRPQTKCTQDPWFPKIFNVEPNDVIIYPVKKDGGYDAKMPTKLSGEEFAKLYVEI